MRYLVMYIIQIIHITLWPIEINHLSIHIKPSLNLKFEFTLRNQYRRVRGMHMIISSHTLINFFLLNYYLLKSTLKKASYGLVLVALLSRLSEVFFRRFSKEDVFYIIEKIKFLIILNNVTIQYKHNFNT